MPNACSDDDDGDEDDGQHGEQDREAISLGVFWRLAPSTRVIIRSKKVCPRSAVIRTTMRSESTLVPPVTAERSPPDSRITGADSPVMADSSTEAMPSMISPSEGIRSLASHDDHVALVQFGGRRPVPRCHRPGDAAPRSPSASCAECRPGPCPCPLPWPRQSWRRSPSRKSQTVMDQVKTDGCAIASKRVTRVPTSTTNITGLRICTAGSAWTGSRASAWRRIGPVEEAPTLGHTVRRTGRHRLARLGGGHGHGRTLRGAVIRRTVRD